MREISVENFHFSLIFIYFILFRFLNLYLVYNLKLSSNVMHNMQ